MLNKRRRLYMTMIGLLYWVSTTSYAWAEKVGHSPVDEHDSDPGLPQMNPEHFSGQIFWILLCFSLLYFLMSKVALPQVSETIEKRQNMIAGDLDRAEELRKETESIKIAYEKALIQADEHARTFMQNTLDELNTDITKRTQIASEEINKSIQETLDRLEKEKQEAMQSVDNIAGTLARNITDRFLKIQTGKA